MKEVLVTVSVEAIVFLHMLFLMSAQFQAAIWALVYSSTNNVGLAISLGQVEGDMVRSGYLA